MINFPAVSSLHEVLRMLTFELIEMLGAGNVAAKLSCLDSSPTFHRI